MIRITIKCLLSVSRTLCVPDTPQTAQTHRSGDEPLINSPRPLSEVNRFLIIYANRDFLHNEGGFDLIWAMSEWLRGHTEYLNV